jgi:hypothetical protein
MLHWSWAKTDFSKHFDTNKLHRYPRCGNFAALDNDLQNPKNAAGTARVVREVAAANRRWL